MRHQASSQGQGVEAMEEAEEEKPARDGGRESCAMKQEEFEGDS